jgi:hypothetical protein
MTDRWGRCGFDEGALLNALTVPTRKPNQLRPGVRTFSPACESLPHNGLRDYLFNGDFQTSYAYIQSTFQGTNQDLLTVLITLANIHPQRKTLMDGSEGGCPAPVWHKAARADPLGLRWPLGTLYGWPLGALCWLASSDRVEALSKDPYVLSAALLGIAFVIVPCR